MAFEWSCQQLRFIWKIQITQFIWKCYKVRYFKLTWAVLRNINIWSTLFHFLINNIIAWFVSHQRMFFLTEDVNSLYRKKMVSSSKSFLWYNTVLIASWCNVIDWCMKLKTRAQKLIDAAPFLQAYKTFMKAWRNPFWRKKNKFDDVIYVVPIVTQQYSIPCIIHRLNVMKILV